MKKTILFTLALSLSVLAFSQKDSTKLDINQVPLITISDIDRMDKTLLAEFPAKYTDAIREYMRQLISARVQALQPKGQPVKKK